MADRMTKPILHQFTAAISPSDAISDEVLLLRRWLRDMGFDSEIYTEHIHPELQNEVKPYTEYKPNQADELIILHYSIGSPLIEKLLSQSVRFLLIYHNLTPAKFFKELSPQLAIELEAGRKFLSKFISPRNYIVGDSEYSRQELLDLDFVDVDVLPICLDESQYNYPDDSKVVHKLNQTGPNLLFVGRVAPNKKQEDLIKLLYFYRRSVPNAHLWIVGKTDHHVPYVDWLHHFADDLGLREHVTFTGQVTQQEMITYYRNADLYVSMSEHEGFGKPLIESMYNELPILAYHSSAVPYTLDDGGILFHHKHYEALAEVVDLLCHDTQLRTQIIQKQNARVQQFLGANVFLKWQKIVSTALGKTLVS